MTTININKSYVVMAGQAKQAYTTVYFGLGTSYLVMAGQAKSIYASM